MRAAVITALTGPDAVQVQDRPEPVPESGQVVVDVAYAGVTFPDVLQTRGLYQRRPEVPFTPGWEVSGVLRTDAGGFRAGDRVAAMPFTGGLGRVLVRRARPPPPAVGRPGAADRVRRDRPAARLALHP